MCTLFIQDDFWPFSIKKSSDHGNHQAKLKLGDDDTVTLITPKPITHPPHSELGFYPMKSNCHGVALIINNKDFKAKYHEVRDGTDRDEYNLTETWQLLGYQVIVMQNCRADKMMDTFARIDTFLAKVKTSGKHLAHDSFVCCILSHGNLGNMVSSDSQYVKYNDIMKSLSRSSTLRGKPKLLFIQACQGDDCGPKLLEDRVKSDGQISQFTDFYLSCATVDGEKAYRDIYRGMNK